MASSYLITFFLLVLIILHPTAQANDQKIAVDAEAGHGMYYFTSNKVIGAAMDGEVISNKKLKGRKMMVKETKEESLEVKIKETNISGASFIVRNCKHTRNFGKCKKISGKKRIRSRPLKENMVGFTAFSADYHLPTSHPPRHN